MSGLDEATFTNGGKAMSKLISLLAMSTIVWVGLNWLAENVIHELLVSVELAGATASVTGLVAFGIMGLLLIVVCFKS